MHRSFASWFILLLCWFQNSNYYSPIRHLPGLAIVNDLPCFPHCLNFVFTLTIILTCESHVVFIHSGLQASSFKFVRVLSSDLRGIKGESRRAFQHQNSFIASVKPHTTQSHQWISSLTSSPSPPTPPRPSPPHLLPLMQLEAAAVAALLPRWSLLTTIVRYSPNTNRI